MRRLLCPLVAIVAFLQAGPLIAQDSSGRVMEQQIGTTGSAQVGADQIGSVRQSDRTAAVQTLPQRATGADQPAADHAALPQIAHHSDNASALAQVTKTAPSAGGAPPISSPTDGRRPAGAIAIGGRDRCDPRTPQHPPGVCDHVIEKRAGDFLPAPSAQASPEQRLLGDQRGLANLAAGGGNLGSRAPSPEERTGQELAAVVLGQNTAQQVQATTTDKNAPETISPEVVQAIIAAGAGH